MKSFKTINTGMFYGIKFYFLVLEFMANFVALLCHFDTNDVAISMNKKNKKNSFKYINNKP